MSDHEVDDVAFLTETRYYRENRHGMHKREMYGEDRLAVCSQQRALIITSCTLIMLFVVALVIAYAGPQNDCPCVGQRPLFLDDDNGFNTTRSVIPIATTGEIFPWNNLRLPTFARPQRYHINIHPNLTTLDVKGQVSIDFQVERDTNFIVFHSKNLTISEKFVMDKKNHHYRIPILRFLEYTSGQQIYMEFKEKLRRRTNYTIMIRYTTRLSRELDGFYLSSYNTSSGEKRYLATTHFEPTYARSAFPCFDEPQFKARFKMSIFRDRFHISLFNMPIVNTEDAGFYMGTGLLRDDFQESVEMSTYLVAFVVCDYDHITERTKKNVSVSVYAPPDLIPQAKFALDIAKSMMDHYEEFFGFDYPLPKQDLIAIPDFGVGAMENWGLITSRTTSILYDPQETSAAAQQYVAVVIAHEIAHQWFGNLVTMRWWNDLWLNEGFASYLEYSGVDHVMPEWSMMDQLILDKTQQGLYLDALSTSHPISVSVYDPVEIEAIFDSISYSKGAAVLYMLEKFLTLDVLRSGLNDYLNIHKYGNADTKDFWSVLSKHANESIQVKILMDSWTRQMGFPVVKIYRENATGEGAGIYTASQSRFLLTAWLHGENSTIRLEPRSPYNYKWYIPLNYYTDHTSYVQTETVWMNMTDVKFEVDPSVQWVKVNVNQSCFYRVNYEDELWHAIIKQLKQNHAIFTPADRASLIDDIFTLSRGGMVDATLPLELSLYLIKERDYVPWATALEHLQTWSKVLAEATPYRSFLDLMKKLLSPAAVAVGWNDNGSHLRKLMRSDILASAVLVGVEDVVKTAQQMFNNWMNNGEKIPPNLREVVYLAGIKYGGVKEWKFCWDRYNGTRIVSEKKLLLKVLGAASDSWLLQRYLLATLSRDMIKPQDIKLVVGVVASNPEGRFLAWRHLKSHWLGLQTLLGNATISMGSFIASVTSHFATSFDYDEVYRFFKNVDVGSGARDLDQSLETIRLNTFWVKHNEDTINKWLNNYLSKN